MFTKQPFFSAESINQGTCNDKNKNKKHIKIKKQIKYKKYKTNKKVKENFNSQNTKSFKTINSKTMYQYVKKNKTSKIIIISLYNTTKFIFNNLLSNIPLLEKTIKLKKIYKKTKQKIKINRISLKDLKEKVTKKITTTKKMASKTKANTKKNRSNKSYCFKIINNIIIKNITKIKNKILFQSIKTSIRKYDNKKRNKSIKTLNGNITNNQTIKIMAWNKGLSTALNKKHDIHMILNNDKPEVLFLTEFNLDKNEDINLISHPNYNIELDNLYDKNGMARTAAFIKKILFTLDNSNTN